MYHPNQAGGGAPAAPLEDHLRNLILANNESDHGHPPQIGSPTSTKIPPSPFFRAASHDSPTGSDPAKLGQPPPSPRSTKRRPNQAQRRQMSAQAAWQLAPAPPVGSMVSPPPYGNQHQSFPRSQHGQHGQYGQRGNFNPRGYHHQQAYQRPQSATVHPSNYGYGQMPPSGPPQTRHQQSHSYQGPSTYNDPYSWRSKQTSNQPFNGPSRNSRPPQNSNGRQYNTKPVEIEEQAALLDDLCAKILASAEIAPAEIQEKEDFRVLIEILAQEAVAKYEREVNGKADFPPTSVQLKCFGSLSSGFATKASDMDLGIVSPLSDPRPDSSKSSIPRILEKAFLDAGLGARLLSRTRVPIIKLCEKPPERLLLDLRDERAKWERGEHEEPEADDEAADEPESTHTRGVDTAGDKKPKHAHKESDLEDKQQSEDKYGRCLGSLKQPTGQNLGNYYAMAKRVLRKVGGRDITHSTAREFTASDLKTLTDVCHAFVAGLADEDLKTRLLATKSLGTSDVAPQLNYRSLYGVYMQVEGERLAMLWDMREIHERDAHQEGEVRYKIQAWTNIQNKPNFGVDLLGYNKELQLAVEGLRKIPSLQIATLEQGQFEPATQYHDRTNRLLQLVGGRDTDTPSSIILPVVISHYIAGIHNAEIREQVLEFSQSMDKPSLRAVARRHKSLQLAAEFERALTKDNYSPSSMVDVKAYIDVLRMPMQKSNQPGRQFDYVVPRTAETAPIITRARLLADPSKLSPNQPRDPYQDRLEFPKTGTGVQCDINFSAHLALQNTLLLRCYSHSDPRVRPMVLFIKHWAKTRGINTPYRGTLSSYGYVLMVLHYLVNVAQPFVCPNLQQLAKPTPSKLSSEEMEETVNCRGHDVRFWRDEEEIKGLAARNELNGNSDSIGLLLRGFFEYYAQNNYMSTVPCRGFDWGRDVLSLRTQGGLRSKLDKGWTGARTVFEVRDQATRPPSSGGQPAAAGPGEAGSGEHPQAAPLTTKQAASTSPRAAKAVEEKEVKEVKHRYLFAIEDPFELEHNVARTVTHSGIVAIRDEFRRAWQIIKNTGKATEEILLVDVVDSKAQEEARFAELLADIHGPESPVR